MKSLNPLVLTSLCSEMTVSLPINDAPMVAFTIGDWILDVDFRGELFQWCGGDDELWQACNAQMVEDGVAVALG